MFNRLRRAGQTSLVSHQTVELARGKHSSPKHGACVMELASMLAGEPFTDRPVSVCPVIGSFLRAYNDAIDATRRQDLYAYASKVIGSHADEEVKLARADRLARWTFDLRQQRRVRLLRRFQQPRLVCQAPAIERIGRDAVGAIKNHTDQTHAAVLDLVDELLAIGTSQAASQMLGHNHSIVAVTTPLCNQCQRHPPPT
jgi:hypothetical protein